MMLDWGLLLVGTAAVALAAIAVGVRAFPDRVSECALATILTGIAEVLVVMLLSGAVLRNLTTAGVVGTTLVLAAVVTGLATVGVGVREVRKRAARHAAELVQGARRLPTYPWTMVLSLCAGLEVGWAVLSGLLTPPYAYDALSYHLPSIAYWIQHNQITRTPYDIWTNAYPMNAELTVAWPAAILRSDALVNLGQLPFAVMGALALVVIGRAIGLRRATALAVASLFLLTPVVLAQITTPYVDVALASALLTAFAFVLRGVQTFGARGDTVDPRDPAAWVYLVFGGVAAGIALGTKGSAVLAIAVLVVVVVVALARGVRSHRIGGRDLVVALALFLAPVIALGSYWYLRDWVTYGNPVYPVTVHVAGIEVFPGRGSVSDFVLNGQEPTLLRGKPWPYQVLRSWIQERPGRSYSFDTLLGGFGPIWPFVAVPALAVFAWWCLRRRRDLLYWLVLPFCAVFLLQPARWWSRFTIMFLGLGLLAIGWAVDQLRGRSTVRVLQGAALACVALVLIPAASSLTYISRSPGDILASLGKPRSDLTIGKVVNPNFRWVDEIPHRSTIGMQMPSVPNGSVYALMGQNFTHPVAVLRARDEGELAAQIARDHVQYVVTGKHDALERMVRSLPSARHRWSTADTEVFETS